MLEAEIVWGLYGRLVAGAFLIFFLSLYGQLRGLHSLYPVKPFLERVRADTPWALRFTRYPTLCWLWPGDRSLRAQALIGSLAAVGTISGFGPTPLYAFVAWLMALSLATALSPFICYPWDYLLLECGFLSMFVPGLLPLPEMGVNAAPSLALVLVHHILLFRVMLGMGKLKFAGPFWRTPRYIELFMSFQPTPSPLAWYLAKLPSAVFVVALYALFLVEVIAPFGIWGPPQARVVVGALFVGLMFTITLSGNFGLFNLLTCVVCLPLLDPRTLFNSGLFSDPLGLVVLLVLGTGGLLFLPWDSWRTSIWIYSVPVYQSPWRWLRPVVAFYRWLVPFHLVHAFGVFETDEDIDPAAPTREWRKVLLLEGSVDGKTWRTYRFRYQLQDPRELPRFFAPHQPRLAHHLYYEAWHMRFVYLNAYNPYYWTKHTWLHRFMQRLLEGDEGVLSFLDHNPFAGAPPKQLRVQSFHYRYTTRQEYRDTGDRFVRRFHRQHAHADNVVPETWELPAPEAFNPILTWWRERYGLSTRAELVRSYSRTRFDTLFWHAMGYESTNIHVRRRR